MILKGAIMLNIKNEVLAAKQRIAPFIRETLLDYSLPLSRLTKCNVYLKCENLQHTNAFKVRGAINKLLSLSNSQRQQGVVTASSGNHGTAVAFGLHQLQMKGIIFLPENASSAKIENIKNYDIPIKFHATDCMETEMFAMEYAKEHNQIYISPYNDLAIIAGQGTIATEIQAQLEKVDAIFVPIGGGGLASGIAGYMKSISPETKIIGCLPENSPVMAESVQAGKIVESSLKPTLSDATAGGIEPGSITFDFCRQYVDDYILVSEQEIKSAIVCLLNTQHMLIEGGAAVTLAALLKSAEHYVNKNVVVILSGANISVETLKTVL